jgi:hypothetical protein
MARTTPGISPGTLGPALRRVTRTPAAGARPAIRRTYGARDDKRIRRTFRTLAAAKAWRADAVVALRRGTMRAPTATTLRSAWDAWLAGAHDGSVRNRSGDAYKPSVLRSYETSMRLRVLPDLGGSRLSDITRVTVQDLVDRMLAGDKDASTIRNTLMPLRAIYRRALARATWL